MGACYAVGSYQAKAGAARNGVILTLSGGKRTALKAALWSNANTTQPDVTLSSVACAPGQTRCAAVGSYTHAKGHTTGLMEVLS